MSKIARLAKWHSVSQAYVHVQSEFFVHGKDQKRYFIDVTQLVAMRLVIQALRHT